MWDGLAVLLLLSASLAASSYLAGILPLSFSLSRKQMRLLTACGTGILVGTALIVIIPEGVETLYSARSVDAHHPRRAKSRAIAEAHSFLAPRAERYGAQEEEVDAILIRRTVHAVAAGANSDAGRSAQVQVRAEDGAPSKDAEKETGKESGKAPEDHHESDEHDFEPHAWVGISIITGFILMYLIDRLPKIASAQSHLQPAYISLERMGFRGGTSADDEGEDLAHSTGSESFKPSSTTTGLVIHAAADGIALGASSTSSTQKLSMIIFFALMIHKAPAAFGLTAVLLKQGLSKRRAKAHLVVFSLAAPVGALVTWFGAHIFAGGSLGHGTKTTFITGLLLLFSGGTFLYVAMHTMQDSNHDHSSENGGTENGYADIYQQQVAKQAEGPTLIDTLATVGGMLLPLLTQFGHAH
ncbi:Metal homeostasis factor ATX2-like protein [Elsinoe fawcettii]|nr:Metal homeostasis factor ATX2-like protein [Elsinoe fawcettii]